MSVLGILRQSAMIDRRRERAIDTSLSDRKASASDNWQFRDAIEVTQRRLDVTRDDPTTSRLRQRVQDLSALQKTFESNTQFEFVGFYGWGQGCGIRASSQSNISQFDSIVYRKNKRIFVEQIGSSFQLFAPMRSTVPNVVSLADCRVLTSGGRRYTYVVDAHGFGVNYLENVSGITKRFLSPPSTLTADPHHACGPCTHDHLAHGAHSGKHKDHKHHAHDAKKQEHAHGKHHDVAGICICGRGVSTFAAPSSGTHARESSFEHAVAQMRGEAFTPSTLGLAAGATLLPIKIGLDVLQARQVPALIRTRNQARERAKCATIKTISESHRDQFRIVSSNLREMKWRAVPSTVFYGSTISNITGQIQGFVSHGASGGVAAGLGSLGFGVLGALSVVEGGWQLYQLSSASDASLLEVNGSTKLQHAYRNALATHLNTLTRKAKLKIGCGSLMLIGTFVPGAQPAFIVGVALLMAPVAWQALKFLKHKLWSDVPHVHLAAHDETDMQMRISGFERQRACQDLLSHTKQKIRAAADEDTVLDNLRAMQIGLAKIRRDDAQRKLIYLRNQWVDRVIGQHIQHRNDPDETLQKLAIPLETTIAVQQQILDNLRTNSISLLQSLRNTGFWADCVVPKSRGILKRWWNRAKVVARMQTGLVQIAASSTRFHTRYQLHTSTTPNALWNYLKGQGIASLQNKLAQILDRYIEAEQAHTDLLCAHEINVRTSGVALCSRPWVQPSRLSLL
jgi:hypothetical protein